MKLSNNVTVLEKRSPQQVQGGGSTFATHTDHTPVFNTVHIIAAVIGIIGAIAVAITIFIICKRKHTDLDQIKADNDIEQNNNMTQVRRQSRATTSIHSQFASDFDNHIEPPAPASPPKQTISHVEDISSPMMQQYQLQLKLLQQSLQVPTIQQHNRAASTSSSLVAVPPPPPYHP